VRALTIGQERDLELGRWRDGTIESSQDGHLVLLDDAVIGLRAASKMARRCGRIGRISDRPVFTGGIVSAADHPTNPVDVNYPSCMDAGERFAKPAEAASNDPEVLRAALLRESGERRRAECRADMQTEIVNLALDLLVREPDVDGFFGALTKMMVEESESQTCGVWLIDDSGERCHLWMVYVKDRLYTPAKDDWDAQHPNDEVKRRGCESLEAHLFTYRRGWAETVEYACEDERLPELFRAFARRMDKASLVATPMILAGRTLGWMTLSIATPVESESQWWRIALLEAVARQAALALHQNRLIDVNRREERRKAILEERNRLARDIHDNLAQGFAAILMQLQAAQRESGGVFTPPVAAKIETAIDLARTHLTEARRSVGTLRPNVGQGEDVATALKRMADMGQRTARTPIDVEVDELPRLGDVVEREIIGIAQEALTNAVRHSRAARITIRASAVQQVGVRLSVADDGRGIGRDRSTAGFGLTSMQERADRIGASLTIVTAPRSGTEVVLAWQPAWLPTQVHVAS
jgi:signal transduction histidine kinase